MAVYISFPFPRRFWWTAFVALIILLAACTSSATDGESATEQPPTETVVTPTDVPATVDQESQSPTTDSAPASTTTGPDIQTAVPGPTENLPDLPDDPTKLMLATLNENLLDITEKMVASGDRSFIPVLLEMMRFLPNNDPRFCVVCSINKLLEGPDNDFVPLERRDWGWWIEWLGNHPEVQPPDGFAGWKGQIYAGIDPRFTEFLYDGVKTRIRLEEVVWGGVIKDGIPGLINPPAIPAGQATYLQDSDRVFGLSINGEHRAYPLRILNPHEMANDVLGGVPFALAY